MVLKRHCSASVAAAALLLASSAWAHAASEQEITDALRALFTAADGTATVTLNTPTQSGDDLVYTDVEFKDQGGDTPAGRTVAKTLTVTGGDLNAAGALTADALTLDGLTAEGDDGTVVTVESVAVENLDVKEKPVPGKPPVATYDSVQVSAIAVAQNGVQSATVESISYEASDYVGNVPRSVALSVDGVTLDPAGFGDGGEAAAQLKAIGYEKLVLSLVGQGNLDETTGTLALEEFSITGEDAGTLTLEGTLGGFTPDVIAELGQTEPSQDVVNALTVQDLTLTFEDASLAKRILDFQAAQMGITGAEFAGQIADALPLMLTALQNPAFQANVAEAAGAFLRDPKNISIRVAPTAPVPFSELIAVSSTAPQTLPERLNVEVTANQDLPE